LGARRNEIRLQPPRFAVNHQVARLADAPTIRTWVYEAVAERDPDAAVSGPSAVIAPTQRDRHVQDIAERGRMSWQKSSDYDLRAKVGAAIGRYKCAIGWRCGRWLD
jgi:hypothetical protein